MKDNFENKSLRTLITICSSSTVLQQIEINFENAFPTDHTKTLKLCAHCKELRGRIPCSADLQAKR